MTEPVLHWRPSGRIFAQRALIVAAITFAVALAFVGFTEASGTRFLAIGLGLPPVVTAIFVLEDFARWRGLREESWEVETPFLIHDGIDGRAMIPLAEIDNARTQLGNVVITLQSGQRIMMRYLDRPSGVAATLNGLRPS